MLSPQEIAVLDEWLANARGHSFDLVIAGRIFGGRPGESPQWPETYTLTTDGLVLHFGGGMVLPFTEPDGSRHPLRQGGTERLTLIQPSGLRQGTEGALAILRVAEVGFGWHYYGRPQTDENWCENWYRLQDDAVERSVTGPIRDTLRQPLPERFPLPDGPMVQLMSPGW
jgi:hypothetical protein